jgi:hypothetical protein
MTTVTTYEVQGQRLELPLDIAAATAGVAVLSSDRDAAASRLPEALVPVTWRPGRSLAVLMAVRYHDNPLGAYDEIVVATAARAATESPAASLRQVLTGRVGLFVHEMPVTQDFTCEAGRAIWAYPKRVDELRWTPEPDSLAVTWRRDGTEVLRLGIRRGGRLRTPWIAGTTYTEREGTVLRTSLSLRARGVRVGPGGARLRLGAGPVADGLRALDLGVRPLVSVWMEEARLRFCAPHPLRTDAT